MDYAELYLWDIPVVWSKPESGDRELISLRDRTPRIAAEGCDIEALIHSEMGRQMVLQFEDYIRYGDEMDPAYVQKWHAQGLDKQVMERNDFYHRWALFTPVSAREKNSRRYPLLFVLHGSSMPINWEEWRVNTLAASILMPKDLMIEQMHTAGLGNNLRLLNKIFAPKEYEKFAAVAEAMGVSKSALAIRMKQLHLLDRDDLKDPYALVRVVCDEE